MVEGMWQLLERYGVNTVEEWRAIMRAKIAAAKKAGRLERAQQRAERLVAAGSSSARRRAAMCGTTGDEESIPRTSRRRVQSRCASGPSPQGAWLPSYARRLA